MSGIWVCAYSNLDGSRRVEFSNVCCRRCEAVGRCEASAHTRLRAPNGCSLGLTIAGSWTRRISAVGVVGDGGDGDDVNKRRVNPENYSIRLSAKGGVYAKFRVVYGQSRVVCAEWLP